MPSKALLALGSLALVVTAAVVLSTRPRSEASPAAPLPAPTRCSPLTSPQRQTAALPAGNEDSSFSTSNWGYLEGGSAHARDIELDRSEPRVIAASHRRRKLMEAFHGVFFAESEGEDRSERPDARDGVPEAGTSGDSEEPE